MKLISWILLIAISIAALVGCGGGGGSSSGSGSGSTTLFITDDLNTGYDHVWVTIKQVTLSKTGGASKTIFDDSTGVSVDLKTLRDSQGRRFRFMCLDDHSGGSYDTVNVVLDQNLVLYTTGSTTGLDRVFAGASGGTATLSASLPTSTTSGHQDLVVDFNLSNWVDDGTSVTGSIAIVTNDNTLHDPDRHEHENYPGTVSALAGTAPDQTFTLTQGGRSVTVQCSSSTTITRSDNSSNPVLADGQHVVVRGTYNTTTSALDATSVLIAGNHEDNEDEARGTASNISAGAGTLDLAVQEADDFVPASDPIHVATTGSTVYRDGTGTIVTQADFFADISDGSVIEAEGTYDTASNTLTATRLRLGHEDDGDHGGDHHDNARIVGLASSVSADAGTFTVTASQFCGLNIGANTAVSVTTTGTTIFKSGSGDGSTITATTFFQTLTSNTSQLVEVEGHWDGTTLTATKCRLVSSL